MKTIFTLSILLLFFSLYSYGQREIKNVKKFPDKAVKVKLSQAFDVSSVMMQFRPGYIKTQWVTNNTQAKEMNVTPKGETKKEYNEGEYICTDVTKAIDVNSSTFMASSSDLTLNSIYPGAIYTGDNLMKGNYNNEIRENRLPIEIGSGDISLGNAISIENPNKNNIENARKRMVNRVNKNKTKTVEKKFRMFHSVNEEFTKFALSTGGSGYGIKVQASAELKSSSSTVVLTFDAYQSVYVISAGSANNNHEYLTALPAGIKANNLLMINSVAYGSRIFANLTITCKSSEDALALASSYKGFGFSANLNTSYLKQYTNKEVTLNYKQVGGPNKEDVVTTNIDQLQSTIDKILATTNYENAVPISYNVQDLVGNNMGMKSSVDKYTETVCFPNMTIRDIEVNIGSGKDGKNDDDYLHLYLYNQNNELVAEYHQPNKREFNKSSWSGALPMRIVKKNTRSLDFQKGGRLHVYADHKGGKDDWYIDDIVLKIILSDGKAMTTENITSGNTVHWEMTAGGKSLRYITKDNPKTDFKFDAGLQPRY